jgi:hypothetical protein
MFRTAPYQIALHDGRLIFAPQDDDQVMMVMMIDMMMIMING